ncbi:hypothetical protein H4R33_003845 [Dimargaris cristalligena]|uniref:SHSP domain-containing protein n=1 Tax=Dimargaris cristalligena TaxID=215637 RepID=A0A4P9ZPU4_9FUNG|nr:hypothetical protein H4R33_003845 [Dimargaris cristalligena]RKP34721.1 hypothetical protein BJ085DRAFT_30470 [Dimargaris cristalligena]|eukprot:RKP34721.1 hypothetical protein BJ085DRAFT_30470 [Dimargaris cristalligena]
MPPFQPFQDRFYRVTEKAGGNVVEPLPNNSAHTFFTVAAEPAKKAPPAPAPDAAAVAAAKAKHACFNPAVETETTDAHFAATFKWTDAKNLVKFGYHIDKLKLQVVADTKFGIYKRILDLPADADTAKVTFTHKNDFIKVHFPRTGMNWVTWLL